MEVLIPLILFIGGVIGGLYGAAVGSAGLIGVPLLILVGLPIHIVLASSRPAAAILELVSTIRFFKEGKMTRTLFKRGIILGILASMGSIFGVYLVISTNEQYLRLIVSFVIICMFILLLHKNKWGMEERPIRSTHLIFLTLITLAIGIYGGYLGFAFGTLITLPLVAVGYTYLQSAVIGRLIGFLMSTSASIIFLSQGLVNYPYAISLATGYIIGGWIGAGLGAKKGNPYIKKLLTMIIIISIIKLIVDFGMAL